MGNKLLQFATFIALSEEYGIKIANPSFAPYSQHFKTTSSDFFNRYPIKTSALSRSIKLRLFYYKVLYHTGRYLSAKKISSRLIHSIDIDWDKSVQIDSKEFIERVEQTKLMFVMGWNFKHNLSLIKHREKICNYFKPIDSYVSNIKRLMDSAKLNIDIVIGIHIRHGDYKTFENGRYYYETEQYYVLMKQFTILFSNKKVRFLICSNSKQQKEQFYDLDVCFGTGNAVEDMYSLVECDYIMGPPSTYTMWASYYGNKPLYMIENPNKKIEIEDFKVKNNF